MIHTLARAGADVNHAGLSGEEKRPALHAAAETCPLDVVKALLDIQPDLNARWAGETALHVAARREKQNKSILEALLRAGCNPRSRTAPGGLTARELAAAAGNSKLAIVLAAAEAKAETDRCQLACSWYTCGALLCPESLPASSSIGCSLAPVAPSCPALQHWVTMPPALQCGRWTRRGQAWKRNTFWGHSCINEGQPSS